MQVRIFVELEQRTFQNMYKDELSRFHVYFRKNRKGPCIRRKM